MRSFARVAEELRFALGKSILFPGILNAFVILAAVMLILSLIDFHPWLAVIPFVYYLLFRLPKRNRVNRIRMVEHKYPELNEKLRTAVDYAKEDGIVIDELHQEVVGDLQHVQTAAFFPRGEVGYKTALIIVLCMFVLIFAALNLPIDDLKQKLRDKAEDVINTIGAGSSTDFLVKTAGAGKGNPDIYGERSMAQLGNKQLEVEIRPANFDLAIGNVRDAENKPFETREFPSETALTSASTYEENIPKEQQEIVKNYFKQLSLEK
ncbi:MAG TPA: hypothetical protein VJK52_03335 [Candidatus Nanoarchaeia archaeon]|nr:hypothetical protein [Candidatus Nanoarchaeia archaeon]